MALFDIAPYRYKLHVVFDVIDSSTSTRIYLGSSCTVVTSQLWGCCSKCFAGLLVEISLTIFKLVSSGYKLHIRYRKSGFEAENQAGQSCIEL